MSRGNRIYSELGIYHIMFRGVNKQNIFEEDFDFKVMCDYIKKQKKKFSFEIYAYCLMTNHVHLILKEKNMGDISLIMKNLLTKYAIYYNVKYERSGHLFEDRYKSKPITSNDYFFASIRYVHQNPVKAYVVEKIDDYKWSSYNEYSKNTDGMADKEYLMSIIDIQQFNSMHCDINDDYEPFDVYRNKLIELRKDIISRYKMEPEAIAILPRKQKAEILRELLCDYTLAEVEKITGIRKTTIAYYK